MRIAILDENSMSRKIVNKYISDNYPTWKIMQYETVFAFVTAIYDECKGDIDCIVVYLSENNLERIEMTKDIQEYFPHIKAVFYSGVNDFADKIFKAIPTFFLKLPFKESYLDLAFKRIDGEVTQDKKTSLLIQNGGTVFRIKYETICYIESVARKMMIHTASGCYETYMKVEEMLALLPVQFVRCHRSYIVNTDMIEKIVEDGVYLSKQEFVPVSRQNLKTIKNRLAEG